MASGAPVKVGFVGLGLIGAPMAARVASSFETVGCDLRRTAGERIDGVLTLPGVVDVVAACDVVCLSLPTPEASIEVVRQIAAAQPRRVRAIIELSTIGLQAAAASSEVARAAGLSYIDAPVSGGVARARTGELAIMAAGSPDTFAQVRPVLEPIATRIYFMGKKPGLGQAMKLANNLISATSLAVTCEAFVFGARLGLDREQMLEVINASTGRTEASEVKLPRGILSGGFNLGARSALLHKDAQLYVSDAVASGMPLFIAAAVDDIWARFADGQPEEDFSRIYTFIEDLASQAGVAEGSRG